VVLLGTVPSKKLLEAGKEIKKQSITPQHEQKKKVRSVGGPEKLRVIQKKKASACRGAGCPQSEEEGRTLRGGIVGTGGGIREGIR